MPRFCLILIGLLAFLNAATGLAQTAEIPGFASPTVPEQSFQSPPSFGPGTTQPPASEQLYELPPTLGVGIAQAPAGQPLQLPLSLDPGPATGEPRVTDSPIYLEDAEEAIPAVSLRDFWGYRYSTSWLEWIPGKGDQFGMFSFGSDHYQKLGVAQGLGTGLGFHFLSGPVQTDMPARVYDFSLAYQIRDRIGPFGYDLSASVLAASDFKGSARKGILFPAHAVGFLSVRPEFDLVFGIDYVDRGDYKLLPVGGLIWKPQAEMRFEFVFPRPRAVFQLAEHYRLYLSGELGGGSWAVDRGDFRYDLATYHDLRASLGVEYDSSVGRRSAFEIGYLFERRMEYSSGFGNMRLDDAVVLRMVTGY